MKRSLLFLLVSVALIAPVGVALAANGQGGDTSQQFVPLTALPGLDQVGTGKSLAPFLSQLYKICIGLAAVLAVLQLMRAGVMYMGGDSVTEKKEARGLIGMALAGLLLVLSPVIVFSIINPNILKLDINAGNLSVPSGGGSGTSAPKTPAPDSPGTVDPGLAGGAQAPSSKIQATGAVNAGCPQIKDGQIIANGDYPQEQCCAHQVSGTTQCQVLARNNPDFTQTEYCSCTKN